MHSNDLIDAVAAEIRQHFRVRPGPNAVASLLASDEIMLSGGEADVIARLALRALGPAGYRLTAANTPGLPDWARELNTRVTDLRAAAGIRPEALTGYLTQLGWRKSADHPRHRAEFWAPHADRHMTREVCVLLDATYEDYPERTLDITRTIAKIESLPHLVVLDELHRIEVPRDV